MYKYKGYSEIVSFEVNLNNKNIERFIKKIFKKLEKFIIETNDGLSDDFVEFRKSVILKIKLKRII